MPATFMCPLCCILKTALSGTQAAATMLPGMLLLLPPIHMLISNLPGTYPARLPKSRTRSERLYLRQTDFSISVCHAHSQLPSIRRPVSLDNPLAENFNILTGRQEITVPHVASPGPRYEIIRKPSSSSSEAAGSIKLQYSATRATLAVYSPSFDVLETASRTIKVRIKRKT